MLSLKTTMINIGLSPNLELEDSWLALKTLLQPWMWKKGPGVQKLEQWFGVNAVAFNSGRSAEYEILKSFKIGLGDEVLLQTFTCVAVPNSVLWLGGKPVYVDIDESLTMDPADLERKITAKSKAVIVQHTFGQLAKLEIISQICKKHGLFLIEDCAHIIKKNLEGDAAFYSFGRDKAISSVFGGMGVIKNSQFQFSNSNSKYPTYFWILQQLLHPVAMAVILPLYNFGIGKAFLWILQKLKLLSFPVYGIEKSGGQPQDFPKKMPNALAVLALVQLAKLEKFEKRRKEIAQIYDEKLGELGKKKMLNSASWRIGHDRNTSLLRYPILVEKPDELRKFTRGKRIILGNWYSNVIDPKGTDFSKIGYQKGSCPMAEKMASQIVNLPMYPRMKDEDVFRVVRVVREWEKYD